MSLVLKSVRREVAGLPAPIRWACAWVGLVTAMMASTLVLAGTLGWVLGVG